MPVMALPLREDETIDEAALRREVDFSISTGTVGICPPGFATEFYKLTEEERRLVIQVVAEQTGGSPCSRPRAVVRLGLRLS
jgi:dihydrodipicolinate synthase/N-acetylneuraminate lyase